FAVRRPDDDVGSGLDPSQHVLRLAPSGRYLSFDRLTGQSPSSLCARFANPSPDSVGLPTSPTIRHNSHCMMDGANLGVAQPVPEDATAIALAPEDLAILGLESPTIAGHSCKVL